MFKLIKTWWNSQFLSECESQVVYQSDDSVKKSEAYIPPYLQEPRMAIDRFHSLTLDTFTIVSYFCGAWRLDTTNQLQPPVISLLKNIKKCFDEDKVSKDVGYTYTIVFGDIIIICYYEGAIDMDCKLTSILTNDENKTVRTYIHHRVKKLVDLDKSTRREQMEQHLQSLLKEVNE